MALVTYEPEGNVAVLTMDDGKANALSYAMMTEVEEALDRAEREAAAVVLAGRAGRFCAGFDLREMMSGPDQARALVTRGAGFLMRLYGLPLPLVVACGGHALAGGALTVLTGDVRFGAQGDFKIGLNEVQIGMFVPVLAMELARSRLSPLRLTAATLHAATANPTTAVEWGYLDAVVDAAELRARSVAEAARLGALSRAAYARTKLNLRGQTIKYIRDTLAEDLGERLMRFLVMHKVDAHMEAGGAPDKEIIRGMGKLVGTGLKSGVFLDGAGLHRSAQRVRVNIAGGEVTEAHGPYPGKNELIASMAMINARSMDDAVAQVRALAGSLGDREVEIGPVVESWDLGMTEKPANLEGGRFLLLVKADAASEAGATQTGLADGLRQAGTLIGAATLAPSAKAVRLPTGAKGERHWVDGPFAESKELIAGFSLIELPALADAIQWAEGYAAILDGNEVDVRLVKAD